MDIQIQRVSCVGENINQRRRRTEMTEERQRRNEEEEAPLQNAYVIAKIGADTAENEQHFAKNLTKIGKQSERVEEEEEAAAPGAARRSARRGDTTADRQNFGKL